MGPKYRQPKNAKQKAKQEAKYSRGTNSAPYGSSNHGDGSVSADGVDSYPRTMDSHRGDGAYDKGRIAPIHVAQHQENWGSGNSNSMQQRESGSMNYLKDKDAITHEDDKRLAKQMLPQ